VSEAAILRSYAGIDPGLAAMGIARIQREGSGWKATLCETVRTEPSSPLDTRLHMLWSMMPSGSVLAVESQHGARAGQQRAGITSAKAQMVERVMGVIWVRAFMSIARYPIEVTPAFVRKCLGLKNNATKQQVRAVVTRLVRGIPARASEHAIDAVAIAIAGERVDRAGMVVGIEERER
jgi:Holliday junction resolvasome RuvABC endonuclease subunit